MSNDWLNVKILTCYALARARTIKSRTQGRRFERGASAVEWAVISAVVVILAILIGGAIQQVVHHQKEKIDQGNSYNPG